MDLPYPRGLAPPAGPLEQQLPRSTSLPPEDTGAADFLPLSHPATVLRLEEGQRQRPFRPFGRGMAAWSASRPP